MLVVIAAKGTPLRFRGTQKLKKSAAGAYRSKTHAERLGLYVAVLSQVQDAITVFQRTWRNTAIGQCLRQSGRRYWKRAKRSWPFNYEKSLRLDRKTRMHGDVEEIEREAVSVGGKILCCKAEKPAKRTSKFKIVLGRSSRVWRAAGSGCARQWRRKMALPRGRPGESGSPRPVGDFV